MIAAVRPLVVIAVVAALASAATAQRSSSVAEVTPEGFFVRSTVVPGDPAMAAEPVAPVLGVSPLALRWTYPNPGATPWITESASVGYHGVYGWLGQNLNGERVSLVSMTDDAGTPPAPIYEVLSAQADRIEVKAADKDKAAVTSEIHGPSSTFDLHYFSPFSAVPLTIAQPGSFELAISDDGQRFASAYTNGSSFAEVAVYDAGSPTPTVPIQTLTATSSSMREHDISGDGSRVLIATGTTNHLYDVASGAEIFMDGSTVSHDAHAIDFDGDRWGRGGFDVGVWVESGPTFTRVLTFNDPALGFAVFTACDISSDGSTFVAAAYDATDANLMRVYAWSISPASATLLWTFVSNGSGSLQDTPQAVSVSDDGKYIAVASWGDQANTHPEVMLFDRDAGNVPIASIDTPGSAYDADLSGDGQFVVAGTKAVHANQFGNGGEGYSLDRGGQAHSLIGTVRDGGTFTFRTYGALGDLVIVGLSDGLLPVPVPIGSFSGALALDPTMFIGPPMVVGTIGASGSIDLTFNLTPDPTLVGRCVFTQSVRLGSGVFDNVLRAPINP